MPNIITDYQDNQSTYFRAKSRFNNSGLTSPFDLGCLGKYGRSNGFHENSPFTTLDLRPFAPVRSDRSIFPSYRET